MYALVRRPHGSRSALLHVYLPPSAAGSAVSSRQIAFLARVIRGALKIRYLLLGGAIGGGYQLNKTYEEWREAVPDMSWMKEYFPDTEKTAALGASLRSFSTKMGDIIGDMQLNVDASWKDRQGERVSGWKDWFTSRWEQARRAAEEGEDDTRQHHHEVEPPEGPIGEDENLGEEGLPLLLGPAVSLPVLPSPSLFTVHAASSSFASPEERTQGESLREKLSSLERELREAQLKHRKEMEKLERENRELRKQMLLRKARDGKQYKELKKSLIDMYSEVLDDLSGYDAAAYNAQDHLPRVVVVGDQSSGKTSVLEMIAQARIFPRGAGEMMTRAPVQVTLSEGPYHVAQFKNSSREYDLTKEKELAELRREIEIRMLNSVRDGRTVSSEVISMSVKGPGLQRMVLVDLPGIISTQTTDMADDTREAIRFMARHHMSNPNAIILCIQDGSLDAERSNVTDLVASMDPQGRRTILVLTKVDLAEENLTRPERIKKILSGTLFPMKAMGYFAVVTGRGNKDDSIQTIREYEESFFKKSKLFKEVVSSTGSATGLLPSSLLAFSYATTNSMYNSGTAHSTQLTTRNLSQAVSECFWKMVKDTVEQQADAFKATRFNLETEWKNSFPRLRERDRDELFEKGRGEILDDVVELSQLSPKQWEEALSKRLWERMANHIFENIYMPAAQTADTGSFNTAVDIKLRQWTEEHLPKRCVEVGLETLKEEFLRFIEKRKTSRDHDSIFDRLKTAVVKEAFDRHTWEEKASEVLRVIQLNALADRSVHDKHQWAESCRFLEKSLQDKIQSNDQLLKDLRGPGTWERWVHWKTRTSEQNIRAAVITELERILIADPNHSSSLSFDEVTTTRTNMETSGYEGVTNDVVRDSWRTLYRDHFLKRSLAKAIDCRRGFFAYQQGLDSEFECNDVVLFWRIQQMLKVTSNALRQQVMNREARRLEKAIKQVLDEYSETNEKKKELLVGRRVELAEELKRVRQIQEKLEEFIHALNEEK